MARKQKAQDTQELYGLDEVDSFHATKDEVLLSQSTGMSTGRKRRYEDDFSDEEVMQSEGESSESEEEVDDNDDNDDEYFGKKDEDELEDDDGEGTWGQDKRAFYGADEASDDEEAKQIEAEALRLQKKHLQELNMEDYMEEEDEEWAKVAKKHDLGEVAETGEEQEMKELSKLDPKTRAKVLNTSHPEFIPLSKELTKWSPILDDFRNRRDDNEVVKVKFTALSAYLGAITSYFALFIAQSKEDEPFSMKDHPVMESILSSKELWRQADELEEIGDSDSEEEEEESEQEQLVQNDDMPVLDVDSEDIEESSSEEEDEESEESDQELDIDISKPRSFTKRQNTEVEDFAEGDIDEVDAEDKKKRRKTLRFYTSKIDQAANRRDDRYTGDADIPYKERLFERQQRLIEEARKRGLQDSNGVDLADNDKYDSEDDHTAGRGDGEDYYNSIKSEVVDRKQKRKEAHTGAVKAAKEGKLAELADDLGEDGKRAINYQILKNKGLTPHRKKENRNSRVKKRLKYEKAQKKLKSVRAVYSGGQGGAYEGEKTGIKKGLSRSVKF